MKKGLFILFLLMFVAVDRMSAANELNPIADPAAVVTSGRARFTVLTDRMIRIQYSVSEKIEDRATFAVINRRLPLVDYRTREEGVLQLALRRDE